MPEAVSANRGSFFVGLLTRRALLFGVDTIQSRSYGPLPVILNPFEPTITPGNCYKKLGISLIFKIFVIF